MKRRTKQQWLKYLKYLTFSLITGILAIALTNCIPESSSPLRIATNLWPGYETLYLAEDLGYYHNQPLKLIDYPSGTEEVKAYRNGEIEGAGLSIDQALLIASTQNNVKIITIMDASHGADVILGRPEITNIKALKGKRVGLEPTALGSFFIARALEKNGMSVKDIEIVSLEPLEHERAYKQRQVDAVVTFGPAVPKILEAGAKVLFDSSQIPGEILDVIVVNTEAIANSPQTLQALVNGRFRALKYLEENPQAAAIKIAKRTGVTPDAMLNAFKGMNQFNLEENQKLFNPNDPTFVNGLKKLMNIMLEKKLLPQALDLTKILDDQFIKNAKL
ncbi:ABC transporter substrate-binding protein [Planktothrix sp. FACHB-1365]|uniref:ABC transporter substrate-binding protein n=1 Tax=Planktothrix sp. FACHB-1365 TaxID=2692855 RepID=UPI001684522A|nr:ABC transporter substrate-binding protein [Planktothrix sp. FACHB-1365]MBD2483599.1 ABC transporter substrate-binding protein [Planktothrix sp. FACHB-1365]